MVEISACPKQFLNDPEVGSAFEEMSGEGVAKKVRIDVLGESGLLGARPFTI